MQDHFPKSASNFARIAALAEVLVVLALGNIAGVAIYHAVVPNYVLMGEADGVVEALYAGLRISLRIGLVAAFGLALLWYRRGTTPRDAGLTRAGRPLGQLVAIGIVLGGFSSFLVALVFAVHAVVPLGEGLAGWADIRESTRDTAFYVNLLATSLVIPPLVEEIMARGYTRVRMVESYGTVGGVVLTGLIFALAHGKFISSDPLLVLSMLFFMVNSIAWTYVAQQTGSVIPSMVAHAMTNGIATAVLFNAWVPFAAVAALVLWQRRPIVETARRFVSDWRGHGEKPGFWFGLGVLLVVIAAAMAAMSRFGTMTGLLLVGTPGLFLVIANVVREKRA